MCNVASRLFSGFLAAALLTALTLSEPAAQPIPERLLEHQARELERQYAIEALGSDLDIRYGDHGRIRRLAGSAPPGATSYELRTSFSTDFTSGQLMHSGSETSAFWFEIPHPDPVYLGVRACNANGCSDYKLAPGTFTWFQGCM